MVWWIPTISNSRGRNRRYYKITPDGRGTCEYLDNEWKKYVDAINELPMEVRKSEQDRIYERAGKAASDFAKRKF